MKALFKKLGSFLTALRVWTLNIVTVLVLLYVVIGIGELVGERSDLVDPDGRVLIIAPRGEVMDQEVYPSDFPFDFRASADLTGLPGAPIRPAASHKDRQYQTRDLARLLRAAAADDRLVAVVVDFSMVSFAGISTALMLSDELAAIRDSGKPLIAYSEYMGTGAYLMAAHADEIYVNKAGSVSISGLGGYRQYTRELTDKLKISVHNYSQGEFKSAVEGFTRNDMSEPDKLQRRELYGPLWELIKQRMAEARGIEPQVLQDFADGHSLSLLSEAGFNALDIAQEQGLIDGTISRPGFRAMMIERFGMDEEADRDTYPNIYESDYLAQLDEDEEQADTDDEVAVVFVQGAIQTGLQEPGVAGANDISKLLRKAHESPNTRALVLRVNSPGGSIIASDIIAEEFRAAKNKGLPVIVSMGDVAASGGMWVSMPADKIYAEPTTITGSIGVAVAFPTFENLLDYIGVSFDGVITSERAGWGTHKAVDADLDAFFARWASAAYEQFIDNVAAARGREPDYIRSIAGGRVWLATRALELGLIDELGSMEDAIAAAAEAAALDEYRVNYRVKSMPRFLQLLHEISVGIKEQVLPTRGAFGRRVERLFEALEGIDRPTATVMCSECMVELL